MKVIQMKRDPKKQPRSGDVLEWLGMTIRVLKVTIAAGGTWVTWKSSCEGFDGAPPNTQTLDTWKRFCKPGVKVIERSEDA